MRATDPLHVELEVWLCPVHKSLDDRGKLKPLDNCVACLRAERDELLEKVKDLYRELESVRG